MKLVLKDFQDEAVTKLVRHLRSAAKESRSGELQSVCLTSTTGSGKTVMLTRALELLLEGDAENRPLSEATFLWITDQPELNEQTRKKMEATSSVLSAASLVVIDTSFDEETFGSKAVHFLNIQKLGKEKGLVTGGDKRTNTIWQTIRNTIAARPGQFFVIIDEAHRGMTEEKGQAEAASIIQKFIKGSPGEIPAAPLVVGISATPERFNQLIAGTSRTSRSVDVDVAEVRASGLIKDTIVLHHPTKEQPTDMTMLREAARALKACTTHWEAYCAKQEAVAVSPLLVVQVEDAHNKGQMSETDIGQAISVLRNELGTLPSDAFAHSFQEGLMVTVGGDEIRYLAPSEIQDDKDARVVFFKLSLNTGWDCPRAEVMMSFRTAGDSTYIAQLVGRMIRTPLARRIVDDETLNTVPLFLPHYDSDNLDRIVSRLSRPDDGMPPVEVERSEDIVELRMASGSEKAFEALSKLPSYLVPRKRKANQVRRLMKLARQLTADGIDDDAVGSARGELLKVLDSQYDRKRVDERFKEIVEGRGQIEIEAVNWDVGTDAIRDGEMIRVDIASENVEDLFEATGRKLHEGLHKVWWRKRVEDAPAERERIKIELFALCVDPDVMRSLEAAAQAKVQEWLHLHRMALVDLDEASRAAYDDVRNLAAAPEQTPLVYPATINGRQARDRLNKHLYVDQKGTFPSNLNDPETRVVEQEIESKTVVGWLRNVDRKPWAICVPYEVDGEDRPMYPDFLVVRTEGKRLVVDMIEPHSISLADAPAKAAGLARFADKHADKFGRIELILLDGKVSKRLDLTDETARRKVRGLKLTQELKKLFSEI
jgi:type III restriction enzyme